MKKRINLGWLGCSLVAALFVLMLFVGGWLMEYVVETVAVFFGKTTDVPMPHAITMIAGAILSEILLPIALVVWLLGFVL